MPTRRALFGWGAALAVGGLAACTSTSPEPAPTTSGEPTQAPSDPDADLLAAAARDEVGLIAAYDAAIAAGGGALLELIRDQHREHLAALGVDPGPATGAPASPSRADLAALERAAGDARAVDAATAQAPESIRVLALIRASEASHAAALNGSES